MKKVLVCLAVAIALFSYGCSSRPSLTAEQEGPYNECEALIKQAGVDIDAAKQAGAETFAKDNYGTASLSYENSKKFLELMDFPKAKESAMRASEEAKKTLAIPQQAETGITETEKQITSAKEAKIDLESPVSFKEAVDQLEAAKVAYNSADYASANVSALKAAAAIKKANEEPIAAKSAIDAVEADMTKAKELKIDTVSPDAFKAAVEAYDLSKSSLAAKENGKAKENAEKASTTLKDEMKKSVNLFIEQAKTDVTAAKDAGAADFAAEQLAVAEESLSNANAALEKADYMNAKVSAEKVSTTAKEAEAKAKAGKEAKAVAEAAAAAAAPAVTPETTVASSAATSADGSNIPAAATTETASAPAATPADGSTTPAPTTAAPADSSTVAAPADGSSTPAATTETPKEELKTTDVSKKEVKKPFTGKKVDGDTVSAVTSKKTKTKSGSKFPIIPVAVVVVVLVVVIFVVRMVRKKATTTDSQTA